MRGLARNKSPLIIFFYEGKDEETDEEGYNTGEYRLKYSYPFITAASISSARGTNSEELFGVDVSYDKTIIFDSTDLPIDEHSIIFIENKPDWDEETHYLNNTDYIITRISKSLNTIAVAVKKVSV